MRVRGQLQSLLILTMLRLQVSVALTRYLNWLLSTAQLHLAGTLLVLTTWEHSHEPKVSGRPLRDSVIASEMRDMFHAFSTLQLQSVFKAEAANRFGLTC